MSNTAHTYKNLTLPEINLGIERLEKRISELRDFNPMTVTEQFRDPNIARLQASIADTIRTIFGAGTRECHSYLKAARIDTGPIVMGGADLWQVQAAVSKSIAVNIALLEAARGTLAEYIEELAIKGTVSSGKPSNSPRSRSIFIVHGHDEAARQVLAGFLRQIDFSPIILNEQASRSKTIIEKIEAHSGVGFAIVLLTPDDVGGKKGELLQARARQNVILELGYFFGVLGRENVYSLMVGELEVPGDFAGIVWTDMDAKGGWKLSLCRELQAAGYEIDSLKAFA